ERRRLDELQAGDLAVKATFELGYGQLEPAQARAFRLLGLADGPDISLPAAAAVLDLPADDAEDLLESLVDTSLLESAAPGRYRFHDLVRLYARACAERDEHPPSEREAAMSRLLDFYLATAAGVYAIERPGDRLVDHLAPTRTPGLTFANRQNAWDWLYSEAVPLLACARQSAEEGTLRRAIDLLWASVDLAESGANSKEYEAVATALRDAAQTTGDVRAEGRACVVLSNARLFSGVFDRAYREALEACRLAAAADDPLPSCWAANILGNIAFYQNRHADAEDNFSQAIEKFRGCGDLAGSASPLCNLSRLHLATGRADTAVVLARQGTDIYQRLGHTLRGANGRYALGMALNKTGQHDDATAQLEEALRVFRDSRQRLWEGMTLCRLAEVDLEARKPARAASNAEMALTVLRGIGGEWRRGHVLTVLGKALNGIGHSGRAQVCWREALEIYEKLGSPEATEVSRLLAPIAAA
ncbi:MAG TPA: tetratricopeptide repeat protein, partial [Streptomyces sp.]|nr:tetratricopeptide repeat protein [Streptomyces sp.]